ncbi:hypothetical protein [Fervidobacterium sp. 2310opik-2]|uniref:hypothetical protein n=1 Tax=Fervidobacterium sp. 2310opik-2 TaxID=1755815 RepID=UPI0013DF9DD6|nr:hypothetical protein [Fervidobacterium sp. 2310opik-2]KAF2962496.1 hypothetical protein AS161_00290 [Fervidobacterium sp. 2310opik-2]
MNFNPFIPNEIIEKLNDDIKNEINNWNKLDAIYIKFINVPYEIENFIYRQVAKYGLIPININYTDCIYHTTESSDSANQMVLPDSTSVTLSPVISKYETIIFSTDESLISIEYGNDKYTLPMNLIYEFPNTLAQLIENVIKNNITYENLTDTKDNDNILKTIVIDKKTGSSFITQFIGIPYFIQNDKLELLQGKVIYNAKTNYVEAVNIDLLEKELQKNGVVAITSDSVVTKEYIYNLKTKSLTKFQAPIVSIWDNYVLYSDGSISDLSFTWNTKISNSPLDYIFTENRICILDISGQVVIMNQKTRRILFSKTFEGAYSLSLDKDNSFIVKTTNGCYKISDDKDVNLIEKGANETYEESSKFNIFYPSLLDIFHTPFGFFYKGNFIGNEISGFYIKDKTAHVITEVGTWKIKF